jgi:hypothetical protein
VLGGDGDDLIEIVSARAWIDGGDGDDRIAAIQFGDAYDDGLIVRGGMGNDFIRISGNDFATAHGGAGDDYLVFESQHQVELHGDEGNDILGTIESYALSFGMTLLGGAGDDQYQLFYGSGDITIQDTEGSSKIVFMSGELVDEPEITRSSIYWESQSGERVLRFGGSEDRIHLTEGTNVSSIEILHVTEFIDNHWMGLVESVDLESLVSTWSGTADDDALIAQGSSGTVMAGYAGNDYIIGDTGNDTLSGGFGDDLLDGGAGSDLYLYNFGEGHDTIADSGTAPSDVNVLSFAEGLGASDVTVFRNYDDIRLQIGEEDGGNSVTIAGAGSGDVIARVEFVDGTTWSAATLRSMAVWVSEPEWQPPVDPPPPTVGADGPLDAESDPSPAANAGGDQGVNAAAAGDDVGTTIFEPPFNFPLPLAAPGSLGPFANPNQAVVESSFPVFEPEPAGLAFGSLAATSDSFSNGSFGGVLSGSSFAAPSLNPPNPAQPFAGSVARGGSSLAAPASEVPSDPVATKARDASSSSSTTEATNSDGSPAPSEESAPVTQTTRRDPEPGGVGWLAQQTDAPRDTAPALTQWAVANALLQFRLAGIDDSAAANASAGFVNSPIAGLPGLSELAPLGMGTSGVGSEGARLQSFSGLNEGLVALAA